LFVCLFVIEQMIDWRESAFAMSIFIFIIFTVLHYSCISIHQFLCVAALETAAECSAAREGEVCVLSADSGDFPFGVCSDSSCVSRSSLAFKSVLTEFGSHKNALRLWAEGVRQKHAALHKRK
jgi:hypothetical protein